MRKVSRRKGIVLVTTMLSVVLVVMLMSAVVYSNLGSMRMTSNFYEREAAAMAAESGINYAITKLENNIKWKGADKNLPKMKECGFQVSEEDGNVIGIMDLGGTRRAVFRIKFNYEDGEGGLDGMSDSSNPIKSRYVSVNNLLNSVEYKAYYADGDGTIKVKKDDTGLLSYAEPENEDAEYYKVPQYSCGIIVEGFCGAATRNATLSSPINFDLPYAVSHAEAVYTIDAETLTGDYVTCASGNYESLSNKISCSNIDKDESSWMRGFKEFGIKSKEKSLQNSKVYYGTSTNLTEKDCKITKDTDLQSLSNIEWDHVAKADDDKNHKEIMAGTYAWCRNPVNGNIELRYYKGCYPEGTELPPSHNKIYQNGELEGCIIRPEDFAVIITDNLKVMPSSDSSGKTNNSIAFRSFINEFGTRPIVGFMSESNNTGVILSADGDISIGGAMLGRGSLTSAGNIDIQGPSVLESDPGIGVSVYAKKDVSIRGISNTSREAEANHKTERTDGKGPLDIAEYNLDAEYVDFEDAFASCNTVDEYEKQKASAGVNKAFAAYWDQLMDGNCLRLEHGSSYFNCKFDSYDCASCEGAGRYLCAQDCHRTHKTTFINKYMKDIKQKVYDSYMGVYSGKEFNVSFNGKGCGFCTNTNYIHSDSKLDCPLTMILKHARDAGAEYVNKKGTKDKEFTDDPAAGLGGKEITSSEGLSGYVSDFFSGLTEKKKDQIDKLIESAGKLSYADQDISGVIFAGGKIRIDVGSKSKIHVTGALIAYGASDGSASEKPKLEDGKGNIYLSGDNINLVSDANYTNNILKPSIRRKFNRMLLMFY